MLPYLCIVIERVTPQGCTRRLFIHLKTFIIMFTKSLLDFPQFVAANSQANTEGWAEAASLEVVAMSDAAKAILSQVVLEVTGDEEAAEKAAKFGLVTRSELSTAAHNGDSAVIYQDDELTQIVKAMADKLGNPAFEAVAPIEFFGFAEGNKAAEWDIWTLEGYEEDGEVVIVEA